MRWNALNKFIYLLYTYYKIYLSTNWLIKNENKNLYYTFSLNIIKNSELKVFVLLTLNRKFLWS